MLVALVEGGLENEKLAGLILEELLKEELGAGEPEIPLKEFVRRKGGELEGRERRRDLD